VVRSRSAGLFGSTTTFSRFPVTSSYEKLDARAWHTLEGRRQSVAVCVVSFPMRQLVVSFWYVKSVTRSEPGTTTFTLVGFRNASRVSIVVVR
jgi:hypothetical protein